MCAACDFVVVTDLLCCLSLRHRMNYIGISLNPGTLSLGKIVFAIHFLLVQKFSQGTSQYYLRSRPFLIS